jgi:ABC-type Zn2+ transport system substrate-binding protein/surface adhesin
MGFIGLISGVLKTQIASLGFLGFAGPDLDAWMKKSVGEVAKSTTTDDIAAMIQLKVRTNMQEKI